MPFLTLGDLSSKMLPMTWNLGSMSNTCFGLLRSLGSEILLRGLFGESVKAHRVQACGAFGLGLRIQDGVVLSSNKEKTARFWLLSLKGKLSPQTLNPKPDGVRRGGCSSSGPT